VQRDLLTGFETGEGAGGGEGEGGDEDLCFVGRREGRKGRRGEGDALVPPRRQEEDLRRLL
jgi:hypothetical protein